MHDGATFKLHDTLWHREWTGDAYHWTTGKLRVGWCELERVDTGYDEDGEVISKSVRRYFVELDGARQSVFYPTPKAAMIAAMRSTC